MIVLYGIGIFAALFAAVMIMAEVGIDSLSLLGYWRRER